MEKIVGGVGTKENEGQMLVIILYIYSCKDMLACICIYFYQLYTETKNNPDKYEH